jgi:uncharacterized protein
MGGKRLLLGLLTAVGLLLAGVAFLVWRLPRASRPLQDWALAALAGVLGVLAGMLLAGIAILLFTILFERDLPGTRRLRGLLIRGLFPPLVAVARMLGIPKERVEQSFIALNNQLVLRTKLKAPPEKVLILLPHCLQVDSCSIRITGDIRNCHACGACPICGLVDLGDRYGVHLSVATGGTIARRIIVEQRPDLIIAVACERDLTSGIQDAHPLPVYGILNLRPYGPCLNTDVDLQQVEAALARIARTRPADAP